MKLFDSTILEEQQMKSYVDREVVLNDISERLKWFPNKASNVVVYYEPGGIGKTSIRRMVEFLLLRNSEIPFNLRK